VVGSGLTVKNSWGKIIWHGLNYRKDLGVSLKVGEGRALVR
jgi:hypothetical protein